MFKDNYGFWIAVGSVVTSVVGIVIAIKEYNRDNRDREAAYLESELRHYKEEAMQLRDECKELRKENLAFYLAAEETCAMAIQEQNSRDGTYAEFERHCSGYFPPGTQKESC